MTEEQERNQRIQSALDMLTLDDLLYLIDSWDEYNTFEEWGNPPPPKFADGVELVQQKWDEYDGETDDLPDVC